jgi:predicted glycoside hydrolase/deacetylase ChbG (UPF0249 family)
MIRCDDIGLNSSVNAALKKMIFSGIPFSASIIFIAPEWKEAVEILKEHPEISAGVHIALACEWDKAKWSPAASQDKIPNLTDAEGNLFPTRAALFAHHPSPEVLESEMRAQIERALHSGLKIKYIDAHMYAAVDNAAVSRIFFRLAREYKLKPSGFIGEKIHNELYLAGNNSKKEMLIKLAEDCSGTELLVTHIGINSDEMQSLRDLNLTGIKEVGAEREAELNALLSPKFKQAAAKYGVKFSVY